MLFKPFSRRFGVSISSRDELESAALHFGILPFFSNCIKGFSIEEMTVPGMLFGGSAGEEGCWEWKGPVIQRRTAAYGKFLNRKAAFVSLDLLPDFLNYRRNATVFDEFSVEQAILDMIDDGRASTSAQLRRIIFGDVSKRRKPDELVSIGEPVKVRRQILEGPLQRLQMSGRLLISDFIYKKSSAGLKYGWGVGIYATPERWFGRKFDAGGRTPEESFGVLVAHLQSRLPGVSGNLIIRLLK